MNEQTNDHGAFLGAFEASTIRPEEFDHVAHVRAAWILLRHHSPAVAIERYSAALKRFTAHIGQADKYNETITWFFMLLIHQRMAARPEEDWQAFSEHNPDILTEPKRLLADHYASGLIGSELARRCFVMPDTAAA